MYFSFRHSTGTPTLKTDGRNEFLLFEDKQNIPQAELVLTLAVDEPIATERAEKVCTGILQAQAKACEARLSLTVESVERVAGHAREVIHSVELYRIADLLSCKPAVH